MTELLVSSAIALLIAPIFVFTVYLACKVGAYGVLMGRRKFEKDYPVKPDLRTMRNDKEQA